MLKWAVYGALATCVLAIAGIIVAARRRRSVTTALTALLAIVPVGALAWKALRLPAIHDITTDTLPPPPFLAVLPPPTGSRIDVRSLSRVGGGDLGANAARIRAYLAAVKAAS